MGAAGWPGMKGTHNILKASPPRPARRGRSAGSSAWALAAAAAAAGAPPWARITRSRLPFLFGTAEAGAERGGRGILRGAAAVQDYVFPASSPPCPTPALRRREHAGGPPLQAQRARRGWRALVARSALLLLLCRRLRAHHARAGTRHRSDLMKPWRCSRVVPASCSSTTKSSSGLHA